MKAKDKKKRLTWLREGEAASRHAGRSYIQIHTAEKLSASLYPAATTAGKKILLQPRPDVVPNPKQRERLLPCKNVKCKNTPLGCHPRTGQWKQRVCLPAVLRVRMGSAERHGVLPSPGSLDFYAACAQSNSSFRARQVQIHHVPVNTPPGKEGRGGAGAGGRGAQHLCLTCDAQHLHLPL